MVMAPRRLGLRLVERPGKHIRALKKSAFSQLTTTILQLKTSSSFLLHYKVHLPFHHFTPFLLIETMESAPVDDGLHRLTSPTTEGLGECKREADALDCTTVSLYTGADLEGWSASLYFITIGYRSLCGFNDALLLIS